MPATAHRDLKLGSSGPDVRALQVATDKRLKARNQGAFLVGAHDGQLGPRTARAISRALFVVGCTEQTVHAASKGHGGHITINGQRVLRHPEIRSHVQLERSRERLHAIRDTKVHHGVHPPAGIKLCTQAAKLGLRHASQLHYTEGPLRWEGIQHKLAASQGRFPSEADCSSFYSWCLWQLLGHGPDVVNGADWLGGFTGTLLAHGRRVSSPIEGCAVIYGRPGSTGAHVAYGMGDGTVISNGSEGGPYRLPYNYRRDIMEFRAYA